jgi:MFS family permease
MAPAPLSLDDDAQRPAPMAARMLALIALAIVLGMALWFAASAAAPQLTARWDLSPSQVGGLTTAVQLGFVLGTALLAVLNLADVLPARQLFVTSSVLGAAANLLILSASSYEWALAGRALTGAFLAGVYPPAMKMAATWFKARRGIAIATVVGALTVGKASPYLWNTVSGLPLAVPIVAASVSALLAAFIVFAGYRDGPFAFPSRKFSWSLIADVVRAPRWRQATGGYLGHMAELYSYWTWIPVFLAASAMAAASDADAARAPWVCVLSFLTIAIGGIGCIWGGVMGDKIGRARIASRSMLASGGIALVIGLSFGRSPVLVGALALAWGFFVIADSAQFSALVTESVEPHAVGTALMVQTCLGFLLSTITIQLIPPVVAWVGWQGAFVMLAIGPALGVFALRPLVREERAARVSA